MSGRMIGVWSWSMHEITCSSVCECSGMRQDWDHESHSGRVDLCRSLGGWPLCRHQLAHQRLKPGAVRPSLV